MERLPRNIPDVVMVDGNRTEIEPSNLGSVNYDGPDEFECGTILTHCKNCLQKHTLSYSHRFPSNISFLCSECSEENVVIDSNKGFVDGSFVVSVLQRRVKERENMIAAANYTRNNPESAKTLIERNRKVDRLSRYTVVSINAVFLPLLFYTRPNFTLLHGLIETFWLTMVGFLISTLLTWLCFREIKNILLRLPEDVYMELDYQSFVGNLEPSQDLDSYLCDDGCVEMAEQKSVKFMK